MHTGWAAKIRQRKHADNSKNASWTRLAASEMHHKMRPLLAMPAGSCTGLTRFKCNHGILSRGMAMQVWRSSLYTMIMYVFMFDINPENIRILIYVACVQKKNQLRIVTRIRDEKCSLRHILQKCWVVWCQMQHKQAFESFFWRLWIGLSFYLTI